jgi:hypothetical protein
MIEPDDDDEYEIDWPAAANRLEVTIAERGLEREPGARDALALCKRCATIGEPPGFLRRPDPLLDFCSRCGLSLDAILLGHQ